MLPPEGPDEDGGELGPPLPPEDRLWRHPSEIGAAALATGNAGDADRASPRATSRRSRSPWTVGALAGLTGAVVTLVAVIALVVVVLRRRAPEPTGASADPLSSPIDPSEPS